MQKGFGSAPKKKFLRDSRYLKFYNDEKHAEKLLKSKNTKAAKTLFLKLLKNGYKSFNIFLSLGFIELNEKNHKEAIKYFTKAKSLSKEKNFELLLGLINSYLSLGDIKETRLIFDESINIYPNKESLIFSYAKVEEDLLN